MNNPEALIRSAVLFVSRWEFLFEPCEILPAGGRVGTNQASGRGAHGRRIRTENLLQVLGVTLPRLAMLEDFRLVDDESEMVLGLAFE